MDNIDIRVTEASGVEKVIRFGNVVMIGTEQVPVVGPVGPTGPAGESIIGPTGPAGESIIGPTGPAGESIIGPTGPKGESIIGPTGPKGESIVGPTGPAGESIIGPTGPKGESIVGPTGPIGPIGPQGPVGATGSTGSAGPNVNFGTLSSLALTETPQATYMTFTTSNSTENISGLNLLQPGVIYYIRIKSTCASGRTEIFFPATNMLILNQPVFITKNYTRTFSLMFDGTKTEVFYGGECLV